ncbi:hypothetical protein D3C72_2404130 [compost metagenome]
MKGLRWKKEGLFCWRGLALVAAAGLLNWRVRWMPCIPLLSKVRAPRAPMDE